MPRFLVPPFSSPCDLLHLPDKESHHASRVLRLQPGDPIEILDGHGGHWEAAILDPSPRQVSVRLLRPVPHRPPPPIDLAPALLKGQAMDWLIQKATELGARSLTPLLTQRTISRPAAQAAEAKTHAWRETAAQACKQCGNPWLPTIVTPIALPQFLANLPQGTLLAAMLRPDTRCPASVLDPFGASPPSRLLLLTGPEGDFSPEEQDLLLHAGALPISLGPLVLRAETAVLSALAILQHEWRRRGWPEP